MQRSPGGSAGTAFASDGRSCQGTVTWPCRRARPAPCWSDVRLENSRRWTPKRPVTVQPCLEAAERASVLGRRCQAGPGAEVADLGGEVDQIGVGVATALA